MKILRFIILCVLWGLIFTKSNLFVDFLQYIQTHWRYYRREARWPESRFWQRRTTPVSIDPDAKIERSAHATAEDFLNLAHLPPHYSRQLYEGYRTGDSAQQIVRAFADTHPQIPDQQIILGLQELVAAGFMKAGTPSVSSGPELK